MQTASESTGKSRVMSKREKTETFVSLWCGAYYESLRATADATKARADASLALAELKAQVFGGES